MGVDARLIDVDFPTQPKYVLGDLGARCFGSNLQKYRDTAPIIPESQWKELAKTQTPASKLVTRIYNQKSEGSCVANACCQAHEVVQAGQYGRDRVVHLSAISLYKRIGRSPNSGAMVSDGLDEMAENGVLPLDDVANRARFGAHVMPNTGFRTPYPDGWEGTAKKFLALEWTIVDRVEELISALFNQHPVVVGRSGHSICYLDPVYEDGSLLVRYANSWGDWGENGFGYDSLRLIKSSSSWAFALRSVSVA